jgi:hypothetical protein
MHVARPLVALLAATLVSLAACSDDEPTRDPSPTPSLSSSPTGVESPDAQPESAEAFIRRWVALHTSMQNTGHSQEFLQVSRGCQACRNLAATVEGIYQAGGQVQTEGWSIEWIKPEAQSGSTDVFRVRVKSAPTTVVRREGAPPERLDGGVTEQRMVLTRKRGEWNLSALSQFAT